jgi:DUF4097 and DUF4098 domain-containing protein YvlB
MKTVSRFASIVFVLAAATVAEAADEEQRSIEASTDGHVSISNVAGSIRVSGWSRNEVEVTADLGRGVEELIVERDGDDVIVKVKTPRKNARNVSSKLLVNVPERSSIEVTSVSADIEIADVYGEQRLHSVSGDVTMEGYEADLQIETVSGDIEISGDDKDIVVQISSVSGDIDAGGLRGNIEASSVSGDLTIANSAFDRVQANTVNGDLAFRARMTDGGRLDMETINGSIDVFFEGDISGRYDIETFNGGIRNCFGPDSKRTSQYTPGRELKFTEGDGNTRVTIRTLNGGVTMCRDE